VQVALEWTSDTDRLRSLVLKWAAPAEAQAAPGAASAN
jgi:hypothetical protein